MFQTPPPPPTVLEGVEAPRGLQDLIYILFMALTGVNIADPCRRVSRRSPPGYSADRAAPYREKEQDRA